MKYNNIDLDYLDKHYGEQFARFCRKNFPSILETSGALKQIITENFLPSHTLYDDIVNGKKESAFLHYVTNLYSDMISEKHETVKTDRSPEELMYEAGYVLFPECQSEDEIQEFKKYYADDEHLCTFRGGRLNTCRVWFAIKKDAIDLKNKKYDRSSFVRPQREDEYGTSVISIQFSRERYSVLSIKNRYNQSVLNPDATFSNDLDNIIPGLTNSFVQTYNLNLLNDLSLRFNIPNYIQAGNGKFYRMISNDKNTVFCENNVVIHDGKVTELDPARFIVFENTILDLTKKEFSVKNSFTESVGKIKAINVLSNKKDKTKTIEITPEIGEPVTIVLNNHGEILEYSNSNVKEIGSDFLNKAKRIRKINIPNVEKIGDDFLPLATSIEQIDLPKTKEVGNGFVYLGKSLREVNMPSLIKTGDDFIHFANSLEKINVQNLEVTGSKFLSEATVLKSIDLSKLRSAKDNMLYHCPLLERISAPSLIEVGNRCLYSAETIKHLGMHSLEVAGDNFMRNCFKIETVSLPSAKKLGDNTLRTAVSVKSLLLPSVKEIGDNTLASGRNLIKIYMPSAVKIGDRCFGENSEYEMIYIPKARKIGEDCFKNFKSSEILVAPKRKLPENMRKTSEQMKNEM